MKVGIHTSLRETPTDHVAEGHTRSSSTTAYFIFNLKVFFVLLGILVSELGDLDEAAMQDDSAGDSFENVTAVVRRVLPALRHG